MTSRRHMPISRDVRVHEPEPVAKEEDDTAVGSVADANLVTVMGFDRKDVLFRSKDVGVVQWRDSRGEIVALLVRLKPDIWGFSHRGDDDWTEVLELYGNPDVK